MMKPNNKNLCYPCISSSSANQLSINTQKTRLFLASVHNELPWSNRDKNNNNNNNNFNINDNIKHGNDGFPLFKVIKNFFGNRIVQDNLIAGGVGLLLTWFTVRMFRNSMDARDPSQLCAERDAENSIKNKLVANGVPRANLAHLSGLEKRIMLEVVFPQDIESGFDDIGGLEDIKEAIKECIIYPIMEASIYSSSRLMRTGKGVLLYGPPGTGKTMMAKAVAKECRANFINIRPSVLLDKYVGQTNKLVRALFNLANKISPCIIFIDEIDSLFLDRAKSLSSHEVYRDMKAEFMALWDGLVTDTGNTVIVLGATNRPQDIDRAILRRMSRSFKIDLPDENQREIILKVLLKNEVIEEGFDFKLIARKTERYSGSDLMELLRAAFNAPCREARLRRLRGENVRSIRPLTTADVMDVLAREAPTVNHNDSYSSFPMGNAMM